MLSFLAKKMMLKIITLVRPKFLASQWLEVVMFYLHFENQRSDICSLLDSFINNQHDDV